MTAFSTAIASIFADKNMAVDALWFGVGLSAGQPVRVVQSEPDEVQPFGLSRVVSGTMTVEAKISDMPCPKVGDLFQIGAAFYSIQSEPRKDSQALVWSIALVPIP